MAFGKDLICVFPNFHMAYWNIYGNIDSINGRFFKVIYWRLETTSNARFQTSIYRRFKTAIIWLNETDMLTLIPCMTFFYKIRVFLESYMVVSKWPLYGIVKRVCVFLEAYIGVWKRPNMRVSKLSYMGVSKRLSYGLVKQLW